MGAHVAPSAWVERFLPSIPAGGEVLDVAAGGGRHSRLAAARGHPVVAVDRNQDAVDALAKIEGVTAHMQDLEDGTPWPFTPGRFSGVIVANYLYRPILPDIAAAVAPGGVLIYETFAIGNERFGRPRNPDFLLRPGELIEMAAGRLAIIAYECGIDREPSIRSVQRICATVSAIDVPKVTL